MVGGSGGGGELTETHKQHISKASSELRKDIESGRIDQSHADVMLKSLTSVVSRMNETAIQAVDEHVREYRFYNSTSEMAEAFRVLRGEAGVPQNEVGGATVTRKGEYTCTVHLDGPTKTTQPEDIYAHELSHAIDVGGLSDSTEWKEAHNEEMTEGRVSLRADTSSREAFAEFGKLLWGATRYSPEILDATFPKCSSFWKRNGLM
jgi:hypothetical protein